ncbi:MAG TPA: helix-turn-helix domain-containing protein [Rudaea sp.]|nr:helix-turn-helix domain-containing protein [Rudaea sp.]
MTHDFAAERARAQAAIAAGKVRPGEPWAPVAHLYRRTDPTPSRQAAEHVTAIGSRADHLKRIIAAVVARPGRTSAELAQDIGMERHEAARRTADAANAGLIVRGPNKTCSVGGRAAVTWWPRRAALPEAA